MNLFTRPMKLLTAVVLEQTSEAVVKALLELGVLDFVHINKLDPQQMEKLSSRPSSINRANLEEMRKRVEALLRQGHLDIPTSEVLDVKKLEKPQLEEYKRILDVLTSDLLSLKDKQKESNQQLMGLEEMRRYITEGKGEYLDLRVGEITHGKSEDLGGKLAVYGGLLDRVPESAKFICLTLRRDVSQVDPLLEKFGWVESSDVDLQKKAISLIKERLDAEHQRALKSRTEVEQAVDAVVILL